MPRKNIPNFIVFVTIEPLNVFKELLVFLDGRFLFDNAPFFILKNKQLLLLFCNFSIFLFIFDLKLIDIFVTLIHGLLVLVKVRRKLDERSLQLIIFLSQILFTLLELDLHLLEIFLFVDISLLVFVHLTTLVEKTGCWGNRVQFLNGYQVFLGLLVHL